MPPLSYYTKIINSNIYDNIYLASEDTANPCVNELLKLYPNIKFNIQSLDEDIGLILDAANIVMSFGTFIPFLLTFSKNIQNLYHPSYYTHFNTDLNFNKYSINLDKYHNMIDKWHNSNYQNYLIINYDENNT